MTATLAALEAMSRRALAGIPVDALDNPFTAVSADVTTTTAVPVKAAEAGKQLYLTKVKATNRTAAEAPTILIADTAGSPATIIRLAPGDPAAGGMGGADEYVFEPPFAVPASLGVTAEADQATTGDTTVVLQGFVADV